MSIDLTKLAAQGRAHSPMRPWSPEELDAVLTLEKECSLSRMAAAEYVRNGVTTPEEFKKAVAAKVVPKPLDQIHEEAEEKVKEETKAALKGKAGKPKK